VRLHAPAVEQLQVKQVAGFGGGVGGLCEGCVRAKRLGKVSTEDAFQSCRYQTAANEGKVVVLVLGWDEWCHGCVKLGGVFIRQMNEATVYVNIIIMRVVW